MHHGGGGAGRGSGRASGQDGVVEGVDSQLSGRPVSHGVADDASAVGCSVMSVSHMPVSHSWLSWSAVKSAFDEVAVDRRARFMSQSALLGVDRPQPLLGTDEIWGSVDPVPAGRDAPVGSSSAMNR